MGHLLRTLNFSTFCVLAFREMNVIHKLFSNWVNFIIHPPIHPIYWGVGQEKDSLNEMDSFNPCR